MKKLLIIISLIFVLDSCTTCKKATNYIAKNPECFTSLRKDTITLRDTIKEKIVEIKEVPVETTKEAEQIIIEILKDCDTSLARKVLSKIPTLVKTQPFVYDDEDISINVVLENGKLSGNVIRKEKVIEQSVEVTKGELKIEKVYKWNMFFIGILIGIILTLIFKRNG
jgi:arsenate reductase-like glutaredoxin family protein